MASVEEQAPLRWFRQRNQAWCDGDELAAAVAESLRDSPHATLQAALLKYASKQGWNGPAGGWAVANGNTDPRSKKGKI